MIILEKYIQNLTDEEVQQCRKLTYGPEGWMEEEFLARREDWWRYKREAKVLMAVHSSNIIAGWALLQPIRGVAKYKAYFFVHPDYRGQGVGTQLLMKASRIGRYRPEIISDWTNNRFFERYPQLWTKRVEDITV